MLRKSSYIILSTLFQLLVEIINCQMIPFKPSQRSFHTATFINDKLYIIGGNLSTNFLNDFFYLDVSAAFNTENLPWVDLSSTNNIVPPHADATSVKGGVNNDRLILYGGITTDPKTPSLYEFDYLYSFDTLSNLWSPKIAANFPKKELLTGIIDHSGKMYLWGGYDEVKTLNDMFILDTIKLIGRVGSLVNAPTPRYNYGAALLPNNNIIYFGGYNDEIEAELPLDQVYVYNTMNDNWNIITASGKVPSSRDGFSVILGLDGQSIIIFGGTATFSLQGLEPEDSLYELNLSSFEWIIPKISNTSQIPKSRMYHKANVIGKYMVISFGDGYDPLTESHILLLDISNKDEYSWTNNFDLNSPPISPISPISTVTSVKSTATNTANIQQPSDASPNNKKLVIVVAILGSLIGGALLTIGSLFLYKWNKNKRTPSNTIPISGEGDHNRNIYSQGTVDNGYNYEQKILQVPSIPIINNERFSSQDLNNIKNELKQEIMQNLRHEMSQNNRQSYNIPGNSNNYYPYY